MDLHNPVWSQLLVRKRPLVVTKKLLRAVPDFLQRTFPDSFVKAPLVVKDRILGTVMVEKGAGRALRRDLRLLRILVEYAGIAVENGKLHYEVLQSEDELRRMQQLLLRAERDAVIGQLAVSINHEINNPLCSISLISEMMRKELRSQGVSLLTRLDSIDENIRRIRDVTQRMRHLKDSDATEYLPNNLMISLK